MRNVPARLSRNWPFSAVNGKHLLGMSISHCVTLFGHHPRQETVETVADGRVLTDNIALTARSRVGPL